MTAPTAVAHIDRFGRASATVTFPCDVTPAMHGRALDLGRDAIVKALMALDGAHPREWGDYLDGTPVSMTGPDGWPAVNGTRVYVRAV